MEKRNAENEFSQTFFLPIQPNRQQQFQEMANILLNSCFSFARFFILAENKQLRSSPLLEAAKRQVVKKLHFQYKFT